MGDTWGISGPAFLTLYAAALGAVWLLIWLRRERLAGPAPRVTHGRDLDTYEIALLSAGEGLAAASALASLRISGAIDAREAHLQVFDRRALEEGAVHTVSPLRALPEARPSHPVEAATFGAILAGGGRRPSDVREEVARGSAISGAHGRLVARHLLYSDAARRQMRRQFWWYVPILLGGVARLLCGSSRDKSVLYLLALLGATVLLLGRAFKVPAMTPAGAKTLQELRRRHQRLRTAALARRLPQASLPMAMALFGTAILWETDAPLAAAFALPSKWTGRTPDRDVGGGGGGGWGVGCGGLGGGTCAGGGGCAAGGGCGGGGGSGGGGGCGG